jgi:hypothetical protein
LGKIDAAPEDAAPELDGAAAKAAPINRTSRRHRRKVLVNVMLREIMDEALRTNHLTN